MSRIWKQQTKIVYKILKNHHKKKRNEWIRDGWTHRIVVCRTAYTQQPNQHKRSGKSFWGIVKCHKQPETVNTWMERISLSIVHRTFRTSVVWLSFCLNSKYKFNKHFSLGLSITLLGTNRFHFAYATRFYGINCAAIFDSMSNWNDYVQFFAGRVPYGRPSSESARLMSLKFTIRLCSFLFATVHKYIWIDNHKVKKERYSERIIPSTLICRCECHWRRWQRQGNR